MATEVDPDRLMKQYEHHWINCSSQDGLNSVPCYECNRFVRSDYYKEKYVDSNNPAEESAEPTVTLHGFYSGAEYYFPLSVAKLARQEQFGSTTFESDVLIPTKKSEVLTMAKHLTMCESVKEIQRLVAEVKTPKEPEEPIITLHGFWDKREYYVPLSVAKKSRDSSKGRIIFESTEYVESEYNHRTYARDVVVRETYAELQDLIAEVENPRLFHYLKRVQTHKNALDELTHTLQDGFDYEKKVDAAVKKVHSTFAAIEQVKD